MLLLAQARGWSIDYSWKLVDPPIVLGTTAAKPGLQFSEAMAGYFSTKVKDDYAVAAQQGKADGSSFRLIATVISDDIELMMSEPDHAAKLIGTVTAPALSPEPLTLSNGHFYLFIQDPANFSTRYMRYLATLTAQDGTTFFEGHKTVHNDPGFDVWSDTTTLFITRVEARSPADYYSPYREIAAPSLFERGKAATALTTRFFSFFPAMLAIAA